MYIHGESIVRLGYDKSKKYGYNLDNFAYSIVKSGHAALIPLRTKLYGKRGSASWAAADGIIRSAFKWAATNIDIDEEKISIVGYSDGAVMSAYAAEKWLKKDISSLTLISPTFGATPKIKKWTKLKDLE